MKPTRTVPETRLHQRLDRWLWHARVTRTRSAAAALITAGHVRVNGARAKGPAHAVGPGDVVTVALDRSLRVLEVCGITERRGDAVAARALWRALDPAASSPEAGMDAD